MIDDIKDLTRFEYLLRNLVCTNCSTAQTPLPSTCCRFIDEQQAMGPGLHQAVQKKFTTSPIASSQQISTMEFALRLSTVDVRWPVGP